ncbi:MAG: acetyl-CoA carboxylase biotin carboxyl carrier protein subunit [candidate division Zixibacteria bacterium]|nr:acetyl-CoA carboxylase biotin carboxyl carrier protein subunit [candidate division Zixibacteria bacterium]
MKTYLATVDSQEFRVSLGSDGSPSQINGREVSFSHVWLDRSRHHLHLLFDGRSYDMRIAERDGQVLVTHTGQKTACEVSEENAVPMRRRTTSPDSVPGRFIVTAPMPGLIVQVNVAPGAQVARGDRLVVIEAMKMENDVRSPADGQVIQVDVRAGDRVESGRQLIVIEP